MGVIVVAESEERIGTAADSLGPTAGSDRKVALDTLRGVALLGILSMNIVAMGMPYSYLDPTVFGGAEGLDLAAWTINNLFIEGTMRGLFSILFGAGIVLMTSRAEARDPSIAVADIYFRRNLWLIAFGLVHSWLLLFTGDILYRYGVVALFLFVFRKASPRFLILLGVLVLASMSAKDIYWNMEEREALAAAESAQLMLSSGAEISEEQQEDIDSWQEALAALDQHPWTRLYPLEPFHDGLKDAIWDAFIDRGASKHHQNRWSILCRLPE